MRLNVRVAFAFRLPKSQVIKVAVAEQLLAFAPRTWLEIETDPWLRAKVRTTWVRFWLSMFLT